MDCQEKAPALSDVLKGNQTYLRTSDPPSISLNSVDTHISLEEKKDYLEQIMEENTHKRLSNKLKKHETRADNFKTSEATYRNIINHMGRG